MCRVHNIPKFKSLGHGSPRLWFSSDSKAFRYDEIFSTLLWTLVYGSTRRLVGFAYGRYGPGGQPR